MKKTILENRFKFLYTGETTALILFIPLSYLIDYTYPHLQLYSLFAFWFSFFLLEFILVQGTYYWYSKWKRLKNEKNPITPTRTVKLLKKAKSINVVIIILAIFVFFIDIAIHYSSLPIQGLLLSAFIFTFAILEFINYFYIQLSYDNSSDIKYLMKTRKLKRSSLSKDFKRIG